ncbi:ATPase, T2SS/T4P/T4SS family [Pseudomonas amygdali]|nr:ATPase, T2SS/T4P/T4SS family [Pseudomonas amygdali]
MNFFRRFKTENKPKEGLQQVTAAAKQPAVNRPSRESAAYNVLSKKDDIPQHSAVLSVTNGPIELTSDWQKNYAILLTNRDKKEVEVICSIDVIRKAGIDDDYLAIVDRIKRSGYSRVKTKKLAKPEIIQIIYEQTEQKRSVEEQQKAATQIQLEFDELLVSALKARASDIHIEVTRRGAEVKFRVDGALQHFTEWPVRHARTMAGVIYMVIAEEKDTSFDERRDQSAIIDRELGEHGSVRVRLNTLPTYPAGFDMIMRILKMGQSGEKIDLNKLGYSGEHLSKVRRGSAKPVGVMMMAGTTGSGKSTSLNAMLSEKIAHHGGRIKVITVEDPPEYLLVGATQVPVVRSRSAAKEGADINPFASTIRAAMRSDPDVLMIGEVRDHHSAELLIHAVQSGHPVFTTTHASSGIDIISRLRSNGVPDDVLGSHNFISALMYQTLLKTVCPHCSTDFEHFKKHAHDESDAELVHRVYRYLGATQAKQLRFINNEGCKHCRKGVTGRTVAAEVILPDAYMLRAFRDRQDSDAMMHYAYSGGKFALHHGITKMLMGQCDIRDVEHKLDLIEALQEMSRSVRFFVASPGYSAFIKAQQEAEEALKQSANDQTSQIILLEDLQEPIVLAKPTGQEIILPEEKALILPEQLPVTPRPGGVDLITKPSPVAKPVVVELPVQAPANPTVTEAPSSAKILADVPVETSVETPAEALEAPATQSNQDEPVPVDATLPTLHSDAVLQAPDSVQEEEALAVPEEKFHVHLPQQAQDNEESDATAAEQAPRVVESEVALTDDLEQVIVTEVVESPVAIQVVTDFIPEAVTATEEKSPAVAEDPQPVEDPASQVELESEAKPTERAPGQAQISTQPSLIQALLPVLESEVQRTGIKLSGRFFKARLSTAAISSLLANENTPDALRNAVQTAFSALSQDELDAVYQTTAAELQALIDAEKTEGGSDASDQGVVELAPEVAPVATKPEPAPDAAVKKAPAKPRKVTSLAQKRTAAGKDKETDGAQKPARRYKSKLLSAGESPVVETPTKEAKPKGTGVVKNIAEQRAKKPSRTANKDTSNPDEKK